MQKFTDAHNRPVYISRHFTVTASARGGSVICAQGREYAVVGEPAAVAEQLDQLEAEAVVVIQQADASLVDPAAAARVAPAAEPEPKAEVAPAKGTRSRAKKGDAPGAA